MIEIRIVKKATYAYNILFNRSIDCSPIQIKYGIILDLPIDQSLKRINKKIWIMAIWLPFWYQGYYIASLNTSHSTATKQNSLKPVNLSKFMASVALNLLFHCQTNSSRNIALLIVLTHFALLISYFRQLFTDSTA